MKINSSNKTIYRLAAEKEKKMENKKRNQNLGSSKKGFHKTEPNTMT